MFELSDFVQQILGVVAVFEPCGYLTSKKCFELGLSPKTIIGMQDPFSNLMNCALVKECKYLVTKDSGET